VNEEPIAARHQAVIERLVAAAGRDERIGAAWLQGSRAEGAADDFSDIDFYIAVDDDAFAAFDSIAFIEQAAHVLVHLELFAHLFVCLLEGPVKLDFTAERLSAVDGPHRPAAQILVDKRNVGEKLRTGWQPEDVELRRHVDQALRMTFQGASWPVRLLRRKQWMTQAYSELTLIHNLIVPLMLLQRDSRAFHRNPMKREQLITEAQRVEVDALASEVLRALADRSLEGAYRGHLRIVEVLGRVGREACARYGIDYPEEAEREALRFYEREWPQEEA